MLGEAVHPRNFNTLKRILDEDETVMTEEEEWSELAGPDVLTQHLQEFLQEHGRGAVESLPDGIHSGLNRRDARGVFFYFQAETATGRQHFWRYVDLREEQIIDNRYVIASFIGCGPEEPRVVDPLLWGRVFELQEEVIADILQSVQRQVRLEEAPRTVDPLQQTVAATLQTALVQPKTARQRVIDVLRFLAQPLVGAELKELRKVFQSWKKKKDLSALLKAVGEMKDQRGDTRTDESLQTSLDPEIRREDLQLVCFQFVTGG